MTRIVRGLDFRAAVRRAFESQPPSREERTIFDEQLRGVLLADRPQLGGVARLEAVHDGHEHAVQHADDLVVVQVDRHLDVQPRELAEVTACVRVLRAEDLVSGLQLIKLLNLAP